MSAPTGRRLEGQLVAILSGPGRMGSAVAEEVAALGARARLVGWDAATLRRAAEGVPGALTAGAEAEAADEVALRTTLKERRPLDHVVAVSAGARAGAPRVPSATPARDVELARPAAAGRSCFDRPCRPPMAIALAAPHPPRSPEIAIVGGAAWALSTSSSPPSGARSSRSASWPGSCSVRPRRARCWPWWSAW